MRRWRVLESQTLLKNPWFDIKEEKVQISNDLAMEGIIVLVFGDWVNVVPLTENRDLVMVRQYRHGISDFTVETPSGSMEDKDGSEENAARRELLEETGFEARRWVYLGKSLTNPGLMNNHIHHFLALDCEKKTEPQPNFSGEELESWVEPFDEVIRKVREGQVTHGFTVDGLYRAKDWLDQRTFDR